jgi:lipoprotein-anchoring transpeptidase ErfK/SrfK
MAGLGAGVIGLYPYQQQVPHVEFPAYNRLGRICVGRVDLKARPDQDSETLGLLYEDKIVPWLREVVGKKPYYFNQRWLETPDGFIYAPYVQPVQNLPNTPVNNLSDTVLGLGMWVEVTVPYVDVILENTPSSNSWVKSRIDEALPVRLYYSQVFWVDQIKQSEQGQILYRVNPNYYGGVDMLWAAAEAFRPITHEELSPINPEIEEKRIVVDVTHQTLSCFEENTEVYFSRVSTGAKFDVFGNAVDKWATPVGKHRISRKFISLQMSGGTTGAGYDLPGIGWTSIFVTGGVAIHSTFWHNDYGVPRSHGCVNVRPEDAKWIFRWSAPAVPYGTGMIDVSLTGDPSTRIDVIEG